MTGWADYLLIVWVNRMMCVNVLALKTKCKGDKLGGILPGLETAFDSIFDLGQMLLNGDASN